MKTRWLLLPILLLAITSARPQGGGRLIENPIRKIPKWVRTEMAAKGLDERYTVLYRLYPYYLRGDFSGDGKRDAAIQVQEVSSGKVGIAVFHSKKPQAISTPVYILGAGKPVGSAGDDLNWVNVWGTLSKSTVTARLGEGAPFHLGEAIHIERRDSTGGMFWWDGKKYNWLPSKTKKASKTVK